MILLKKPYTPVVFTSAVKTFSVYGKSFFNIRNVYLSGHPHENTTFFNPFSGVPRLSASYTGFTGIKLLSSAYSSNNINTITFTMPSATRAGYVDIIVENEAGYGKLTQYIVKALYSGIQPLSTISPWSQGIKVLSEPDLVLPDNLLYTFTTLSGMYTFSGNGIMTFPQSQVEELFTIDNENVLISIASDAYIATI